MAASRVLSVSLLCVLTTLSCNVSEIVEDQSGPGALQLTWVRGLRKDAPAQSDAGMEQGSSQVFDLGDVNGSTDFFFVLSNTGGSVIRDLTLSSTNSSLVIYPEEIDSLPPGSAIDLTNVNELELVRMTAIHGPLPFSPIPSDLMPAGLNSTTVQITGTSLAGC